MLRSHGEVWRPAGARPTRSSYARLIWARRKASASTVIASTAITLRTADMLSVVRLPCNFDPIQTASSGAPVQMLIETSADAATSPIRFRTTALLSSRVSPRGILPRVGFCC
jgi:hypothetical protein